MERQVMKALKKTRKYSLQWNRLNQEMMMTMDEFRQLLFFQNQFHHEQLSVYFHCFPSIYSKVQWEILHLVGFFSFISSVVEFSQSFDAKLSLPTPVECSSSISVFTKQHLLSTSSFSLLFFYFFRRGVCSCFDFYGGQFQQSSFFLDFSEIF